MPSKEDICFVQETLPSKNDFLTADVEELVAAIKHNLQLKAKPHHSICSKQRRMSPYVPSSKTWRQKLCDKENTVEHSSHNCKYRFIRSKSPISDSNDDPYEMLQELLREGSLIKEAVKRLEMQLELENNRPKKPMDFYDLEFENEEVESI